MKLDIDAAGEEKLRNAVSNMGHVSVAADGKSGTITQVVKFTIEPKGAHKTITFEKPDGTPLHQFEEALLREHARAILAG